MMRQSASARSGRNGKASLPGRTFKTLLTTLAVAGASGLSVLATPVFHGISAANLMTNVTASLAINGFSLQSGSTASNFKVQINPTNAALDVSSGILIGSIAENGFVSNTATWYGTPAVYSGATASPGSSGTWAMATYGTVDDTNYPATDFNAAAAYFPYSKGWFGGWLVNTGGTNNQATVSGAFLSNDTFYGNTNMVVGTNITLSYANGTALGSGSVMVNLLQFGLDSRSNAILLCCGGKNEENFASCQANTNGTWTVTTRDDASGSGEGDPNAFVCIPMTNTTVIAGRFNGCGPNTTWLASYATSNCVIAMQNAPFFVTNTAPGTYHLVIPGVTPGHGVLIISAEESTTASIDLDGNDWDADNIVSYQATADGWDIQTRDVGDGNKAPNLQTLPSTEAVASFVYIPAPTPGVTVTPTNGLATTQAGGTASFTVTLDAPPTAEVDLNLAASDSTAGVLSTSTLVFEPTNWNIAQTVTVTGVNNSVSAPEAYTVNFQPATSADTNYNGWQTTAVSLVNIPTGQPGIFLVPTNGLTTTGAGGTTTFEAIMNLQPAAAVTVNFSSSALNEGVVSPATVTFNSANWNTPQIITVTGVDDGLVNGNISYQIIAAPAVSTDPNYNGFQAGTVNVLNLESDVAGVTLSIGSSINVPEGGTTSFTVALSAEPTNTVTINYASSDTTAGTVSPATLTFTPGNWNVPQTVTLAGVANPADNGNSSYFLTATVTSVNIGYATLTLPNISATTVKAVGLPSGICVYGLGMVPVGIDGQATVNESLDFDNATLTFALTTNADPADVLSVRDETSIGGPITVSGNTVSYNGSAIATFTPGAGTTPLVITIQPGTPGAAVQTMLEAVTFSSTTTNNFANRALSVTLNYGSGSSTVGKIIRVGQLRVTQYQDGVDYGYGTYINEANIEVTQTNAYSGYPSGSSANNGLFVELNSSSNDHEVLMRFDNLIGTNVNQIPPGAIIVSADLNLNILNSGDGFAMNRMLIPWDGTNSNWSSFPGSSGVDADDSTAVAANYSQLGFFTEGAGAGGTVTYNTTAGGVGDVTVGVTPDIQAWVAGQANYGWVFDAQGVLDANGNQPWSNLTDGTGFSPASDPNPANRPRLRVYWLPAGTPGTSFSYGDTNNYTNTFDCEILQTSPTVNTPHGTYIWSDGADYGEADATESLIQFDNIIGTAANQVPPGAHIEVAMLNLASVDGSDALVGDGGQFFALYQPWQDTNTTWNSWGVNGIVNDGVMAATTPTATAGSPALTPNVQGGYHSFEVTPDVQNWDSGKLPNYGWGIVPWSGGSDGWGMDTSEDANPTNRPQLVVYYTLPTGYVPPFSLLPPLVSSTQVVVQFNGTADTTYTVWRAGSISGPWTSLGTATVGQNGLGTFNDTAPLPASGFYRVSNP